MAIHHHQGDLPGHVTFEGSVAIDTETMGLNPFRDALCGRAAYSLDVNGCARPPEGVGCGLGVDEAFVRAHPLIEGPCYV